MKDHMRTNPPEVLPANSLKAWREFVGEGAVQKSLSIAYRYDGDRGFSFVFPFFIVKHMVDPLAGGFILHRMYLKDHLKDFGWMALYTPSASPWLDTYIAAGAEWDKSTDQSGLEQTNLDFVLESGLKFRVNVLHSPAKFLGAITPYWGIRAGIKNSGAFDIEGLNYVLEFGAGSF